MSSNYNRRSDDPRFSRIETQLDYLGTRIDYLTSRIMWAVISASCGVVLMLLGFITKILYP